MNTKHSRDSFDSYSQVNFGKAEQILSQKLQTLHRDDPYQSLQDRVSKAKIIKVHQTIKNMISKSQWDSAEDNLRALNSFLHVSPIKDNEDFSSGTLLGLQAYIDLKKGRFEVGSNRFREAIAEIEKEFGRDDHKIAHLLIQLSDLLTAPANPSKRFRDAIPFRLRAVENLRHNFPDNPVLSVTILSDVGYYCIQLGEQERARRIFSEVFDTCSRILGPEHHYTKEATKNLVKLLTDLEDQVGLNQLQEVLDNPKLAFDPKNVVPLNPKESLKEWEEAVGKTKENKHGAKPGYANPQGVRKSQKLQTQQLINFIETGWTDSKKMPGVIEAIRRETESILNSVEQKEESQKQQTTRPMGTAEKRLTKEQRESFANNDFTFSGLEFLEWRDAKKLLGENRECSEIELYLLKRESNPKEIVYPADTTEGDAKWRRYYEVIESPLEDESEKPNYKAAPRRHGKLLPGLDLSLD